MFGQFSTYHPRVTFLPDETVPSQVHFARFQCRDVRILLLLLLLLYYYTTRGAVIIPGVVSYAVYVTWASSYMSRCHGMRACEDGSTIRCGTCHILCALRERENKRTGEKNVTTVHCAPIVTNKTRTILTHTDFADLFLRVPERLWSEKNLLRLRSVQIFVQFILLTTSGR